MDKERLSLFEASAIITGYGIGGGIMAVPYLVSKTNPYFSLILILAAYVGSLLLHLMMAELTTNEGNLQVVEIAKKYLFKDNKILTVIFFGVMLFVFITSLSVYIVGGADIILQFLNISELLAQVIFYAIAAVIALFGLKILGVSEKIAILIILGLYVVLIFGSFSSGLNPIEISNGKLTDYLGVFSMVMFCFAAFFSVPQAAKGLAWDKNAIGKAVVIGLGINLVIILITVFLTLSVSNPVTEVAIIGWSKGIGTWANIIGSVVIILAMLTSYWSISFALSTIVEERLNTSNTISWIIATVPSFVLVIFTTGGFISFINLAAGGIGLIIPIALVPMFRRRRRLGDNTGWSMGKWGSTPMQVIVILCYILMSVGALI
jgi:amino acid permease